MKVCLLHMLVEFLAGVRVILFVDCNVAIIDVQ
jgi:hypothetical protein